MKVVLSFIVLMFTINQLNAQPWGMRENQRKRLEEFKKIKLIETLDLTEDESTRFFALYNEHQKKVWELQRERDKVLDQLERLTKDESKFQPKKFEELEQRLNDLERELFRNRTEFHSSIKNVLSPYKVAKFYVFEREFMREINKLLMKRSRRSLEE
jgi:predicted nuclease with TOPRIM domain